jgi:hypothetical protein
MEYNAIADSRILVQTKFMSHYICYLELGIAKASQKTVIFDHI